MGLCEETAFLRLLPTSGWRLVWTWETVNGTRMKISGSSSSRSDCFVELVNLFVVLVVFIVCLGLIVRYRCGDDRKR